MERNNVIERQRVYVREILTRRKASKGGKTSQKNIKA